MAEYQKIKNHKGITHSKATMLVLFLISIVLIAGLFSIIPKERATRENKKQVIDALNLLQNQSSSLAYQIENLKTEAGIEEKIREKYRVVKEGEGLIVIVDEKKSEESAPISESNNFWDFFRNIFN